MYEFWIIKVTYADKSVGISSDGYKHIEDARDGDIYLGVECFFIKDNTRIRVEYDIYKTNPYIDVKVDVFAGDVNQFLKYDIIFVNRRTI